MSLMNYSEYKAINELSREQKQDEHAFLSPSQYHWINYSDEKLLAVYKAHIAAKRGSVLHAFARMCILLRQRLPRSTKTLNMYVNDAIGFNLSPERKLFYSKNCFGKADAIGFNRRYLRIHDLKTGVTKASFNQLNLYAAIFCLQYGHDPSTFEGIETRIYQNDSVMIDNPPASEIQRLMDIIKHFDELIEKYEEENQNEF